MGFDDANCTSFVVANNIGYSSGESLMQLNAGSSSHRAQSTSNAASSRPLPGGYEVVGNNETCTVRVIKDQETGHYWGRIRLPNVGPLIFIPPQLLNSAIDETSFCCTSSKAHDKKNSTVPFCI